MSLALKHYLNGKGRDVICKDLGISHATFDIWSKEGQWKEMFKGMQARLRRKVGDQVTREKIKSLKLIKIVENKFKEKLEKNEDIGLTISSFSQLERLKWDILLPRNTHQFGIMHPEEEKEEIMRIFFTTGLPEKENDDPEGIGPPIADNNK